MKRSVDVCYYHKCTPIKVKRYEGFAAMSRRASATNGSRQPPDPRPMEQQQQAAQAAVNTRGSNLVLTSNTGDLPHFTLEETHELRLDHVAQVRLAHAAARGQPRAEAPRRLPPVPQRHVFGTAATSAATRGPALPKRPFE